jgi:hypothetical protein
MEKKSNKYLFFIILLGILILFPSISAVSGAGSGTSGDPYQITNCSTFQEIENATSSSIYYSVINNINCAGYPFRIIEQISCSINGNGYTISNLYIYNNSFAAPGDPGNNRAGIFGYMTGTADISNINFVNASVTAISAYDIDGGGLVGLNQGAIVNVSYGGLTRIEGASVQAGGLAGASAGFINNSRMSGVVRIWGDAADIYGSGGTVRGGGLVGYASITYGATIFNSSSNATVWVTGEEPGIGTTTINAGGLVGYMWADNNPKIISSYSTGNVTTYGGATYTSLGGFIGYTWSTGTPGTSLINNSFAIGNVSCNSGTCDTGGFIGRHGNTPIYNSFATGDIISSGDVGGFTGYKYNTYANVTRCFFDINTTGYSAVGNGVYTINPVAKNTTEMKSQSTYVGWDFVNTWSINPLINNGYPYIISNTQQLEIESPPAQLPLNITLNYPINNYNSSSNSSVTFNYTIYPNGIFWKNASLYVDNSLFQNNEYDNLHNKYDFYQEISYGPLLINSRAIEEYNNFFLVANDTKIYNFTTSGTYQSNFSLPFEADAITTNGTIIFIGKYYSVYRYNTTGNYLGSSFLTTSTDAMNISGLSNDGTWIWITDSVTNKVYKFYINGTYAGFSFNATMNGLKGINVNGTDIWIMNNSVVQRYDYNGNYIESFNIQLSGGTYGYYTGGITSDDSYFYIPAAAPTNSVLNIFKYYKQDTIDNTNRTITTTKTLGEGIHTWFVRVFNSTSQIAQSITRTFTIDTYAPSIIISSPTEYQSFTSGANIPFIVSETDSGGSGIDKCWYSKNNGVTNITYICTNDFNVSEAGDGTYNVTVWANDSLGNLQSAKRYYVVSATYPSVTINYPPYGTGINTINFYLNVTATDSDGIANISLWTNSTGTWHLEQTNTTPVTSGVMYGFLETLNDGYYKFNFQVFDKTGLQSWSASNSTFTLDTTIPSAAINSITTTAGSYSLSFSTTEADNNLASCKYSVYNSSGIIDWLGYNSTYLCNNNPHPAYVYSGYGTYTLYTYVTDAGGNLKTTSLNFTVSALSGQTYTPPAGGGGGGGGGGGDINATINQTLSLFGYCGDGICQDGRNGTYDRGEDFYSCAIDCRNIFSAFTLDNFNLETLITNCFSKDEELKERCVWNTTPGLFLLLILIFSFFIFSIFFEIKPQNEGRTFKVVYNKDLFRKKKRRR